MAQEWARKIERDMDTMNFKDGRSLSSTTLADLIDQYTKEIGAIKSFGRNKKDVLRALKQKLGAVTLPELTAERLGKHIKSRIAEGAGGVTIAVELSYLGSVYKAAIQLWKALYVFQGHERWKGAGVKKSVKLMRSAKKWNCAFRI